MEPLTLLTLPPRAYAATGIHPPRPSSTLVYEPCKTITTVRENKCFSLLSNHISTLPVAIHGDYIDYRYRHHALPMSPDNKTLFVSEVTARQMPTT
jgi:hypothetical protein